MVDKASAGFCPFPEPAPNCGHEQSWMDLDVLIGTAQGHARVSRWQDHPGQPKPGSCIKSLDKCLAQKPKSAARRRSPRRNPVGLFDQSLVKERRELLFCVNGSFYS